MGGVKQPWHVRDPAALRTLEADLAREFPTLHVVVSGDLVVLKGAFEVRDGAEVLDWYSVEIELLPDHPKCLPVVRETGGRIPWVLDPHHVLPNGRACVVLPDAYWLENATGEVSLLEYLRGPLHQYFVGQCLVETGDPWPRGEWAHGPKGMFEHYASVFGTQDVWAVCRLMFAALKPMKGHLSCPCGSGHRYRRCHRDLVLRIRSRVPLGLVARALEFFLEAGKKSASEATRTHT
jgi:hypothetical protein